MSRLWRNRSFALLWSGATASALGNWASYIAANLFAYQLTGRWTALAAVMVMRLIPSALCGPIAGALADRVDRRRLMIAADVARCALYLLLPFSSQAWHVYLVSFAAATATQFYLPASQAAVPSLVGPAQLLAANAFIALGTALTPIVGPALGGLMTATWGPASAFLFNAATFAFSACCLLFCRFPPVARRPTPAEAMDPVSGPARLVVGRASRLIVNLREGARALVAAPLVPALLWPRIAQWVGCGMYNVLLPVLAAASGRDSGVAYGLLISAWGAGTAAGALAVVRLKRRRDLARLYPAAIAWQGVFVCACLLAPTLPAALTLLLVGSIGDAAATVIFTTMVGQLTRDETRGRVFGLCNAGVYTATAAGIMVAGAAIDALPIGTLALAASGAMLVAAAMAGCLIVTALHRSVGSSLDLDSNS